MADEALDASETLGQREKARSLEDGRSALDAPGLESDHAAEAGRLALVQRVSRMIREPGIEDLLQLGVLGKPCCDRAGVGLVPLHPDRERLQPPEHEEAVE